MSGRQEGKTKEQLYKEVRELRQKIRDLEVIDSERRHSEEEMRKMSHVLTERVKELHCLMSISKLRDRPGVRFEEILQGIVDLIPSAWQFPHITCARLVLPNREFRTENFRETPWKQESKVLVNSKRSITIEVYYLEEKQQKDEGPFLKEERNLLDAIAERVEKVMEHKLLEEKDKKQQEQLIQLDKMAALGTLVSGVAHEINNPNNSIMLNTPVLMEAWESIRPVLDEYHAVNGDFVMGGLPYSEMCDNIPLLFSGIVEGSRRIKNIVESLKDFARIGTPALTQSVSLNTVVKSALLLLKNSIEKHTKHFSVKYGAHLPQICGNSQRLEQVIINLVQNACEALPDPHKGISVSTSYDGTGRTVIVTVKDEGVGIPSRYLPYIQDPFFTLKRSRGGTGLGLSVSSGIVKEHGGTLNFTSVPGEGTTVILSLPASGDRLLREGVDK